MAELVVIGAARGLEGDQQGDQQCQDRKADDPRVAPEQREQDGDVGHPQREDRDGAQLLRQPDRVIDQQADRGEDEQREQQPVVQRRDGARLAAAVRRQGCARTGRHRMKTRTARATQMSAPMVNSCHAELLLEDVPRGSRDVLDVDVRPATTDERLSQMPSAAPSSGNVASKRGPQCSIQRNVPPGSPAMSS